jgi:hypothetical protein
VRRIASSVSTAAWFFGADVRNRTVAHDVERVFLMTIDAASVYSTEIGRGYVMKAAIQ